MSRIEDVCRELNNWFDMRRIFGDFEITKSGISNELNLQEGQFYRIIGSVFNDGVYQIGDAHVFTPEIFTGAVWAMAVPPAVIALCGEIDAYEEKYADIEKSPFQSESFGGYSYTKASGGSTDGSDSNGADWKSVFRSKLSKWRKVRAL